MSRPLRRSPYERTGHGGEQIWAEWYPYNMICPDCGDRYMEGTDLGFIEIGRCRGCCDVRRAGRERAVLLRKLGKIRRTWGGRRREERACEIADLEERISTLARDARPRRGLSAV